MRILRVIGRILLFLVILSSGTIAALVAGETKGMALSGLRSATVHSLASQETHDVVYAAVSGGQQPTGIYRSDDAGNTWQVVSSGPGVAINALVVDPSNTSMLFAGTNGGPGSVASSLWKSDTGGASWRRFVLSLPEDPYGYVPSVTTLLIHPDEPDVLYIGTDGQGVYRYDAGGKGYQLVGSGSLHDASVFQLAVLPNRRIYAVTNRGLFAAAGDVWVGIETVPERLVSIAAAGTDPTVLYAGGSSCGLFKSTDGGVSWLAVGPARNKIPGASLRVTAVSVDADDSDHVVAASAYVLGGRLIGNAIDESRDAGATWDKVVDLDAVVSEITVEGPAIFAATDKGLLRYGVAQTQPSLVTSLPNPLVLANPTGLQVLILILTLTLAGLVALGKGEWLLRRRPVSA